MQAPLALRVFELVTVIPVSPKLTEVSFAAHRTAIVVLEPRWGPALA